MGKKVDDKDLPNVTATDAELEEAFNSGFDDKGYANDSANKKSSDDYVEVPEPKIASEVTKILESKDDKEPAPAEEPKDEWADVSDVIRAKFDAMATQLEQVTNIANSASGRANKIENKMLDQKLTPPTPEKPTSQQILEALGNKTKREELRADWGDFVAALDEIDSSISTSVGSAIDKLRTEFQNTSKEYKSEVSVQRNLDIKHPGWENTVNKVEFKDWVYEGGPSVAERGEYERTLSYAQSLHNNSPTESTALYGTANAYYDSLLVKYPSWAKDRGNLYGKSSGEAAIELLDMHKLTQQQKSDVLTKQNLSNADEVAARKQRLSDNITPTRGATTAPAPPGIDEDLEAAFVEGFNS